MCTTENYHDLVSVIPDKKKEREGGRERVKENGKKRKEKNENL